MCYLSTILPVYEELARIELVRFEKNQACLIWKKIVKFLISWNYFMDFVLGDNQVLVFPLSYLKVLFLECGDTLIQHLKITICLYWKMFMILFGSFIVSYASFYVILFTCGSVPEIHGPLLYHIFFPLVISSNLMALNFICRLMTLKLIFASWELLAPYWYIQLPLGINTWMSTRHLKVNKFKIELLTSFFRSAPPRAFPI